MEDEASLPSLLLRTVMALISRSRFRGLCPFSFFLFIVASCGAGEEAGFETKPALSRSETKPNDLKI
ncbi:hypothetical protein ACFXTH_013685 [Malus domestica]